MLWLHWACNNVRASIGSLRLSTAAAGLVKANCPQRIAKVHDQFLSFVALEGRLFSLGLPDSYLQLNDPKAQDTQIQVCNFCHHLSAKQELPRALLYFMFKSSCI